LNKHEKCLHFLNAHVIRYHSPLYLIKGRSLAQRTSGTSDTHNNTTTNQQQQPRSPIQTPPCPLNILSNRCACLGSSPSFPASSPKYLQTCWISLDFWMVSFNFLRVVRWALVADWYKITRVTRLKVSFFGYSLTSTKQTPPRRWSSAVASLSSCYCLQQLNFW
jgi:hypothetical protein